MSQQLPYVEQLAGSLSANVILLQAVSVRIADDIFGGGYVADPAPIEEELVKQSEAYLSRVSSNLSGKGIDVQWRVMLDTALTAIVYVAQNTPNSLVTMCTRGQSGVTRLIVGSVTANVVRECGSPILVVPAKVAAQ